MAKAKTIEEYNEALEGDFPSMANALQRLIDAHLPNSHSKLWHGHPVWFLVDNPIVGYSLEKKGLRLMFWSGADFNEPTLNVLGGKFKDASCFFTSSEQIDTATIQRCLQKAQVIQWDYKNIVKRKGVLERLI